MPTLTALNAAALRRKQAADAPPTLQQENLPGLQMDALKDVLAAGLLAGSLGVGARALLGSRYLFGRPAPAGAGRTVLPTSLGIPTPVYRSDKAKEQSLANAGAAQAKAAGFGNWLAGADAISKEEIPMYLPALVTAGLGGAYGGYHLADKLIEGKRRTDLGAEQDAARERFRNALLASYDPARIPAAKAAAAGPDLAAELDRLADLAGVSDEATTVKQALVGGRTLGQALGIYGAMAVPLALLSGAASYQYTKARGGDRLLDEALKRRQRERMALRPPEVNVLPEPVHVTRTGVVSPDNPAPMDLAPM